MGKHEKMAKWEEDAIKQSLQKAAEAEQIPESLHPKQMEAWLVEAVAKKEQAQQDTEKAIGENQESPKLEAAKNTNKGAGSGKAVHKRAGNGKVSHKWRYGMAAAACLAVVLFVAGRSMDWNIGFPDTAENRATEDMQDGAGNTAAVDDTASDDSAADDLDAKANTLWEGTTYKELYQAFCEVWEGQEGKGYYSAAKGDMGGIVADDGAMQGADVGYDYDEETEAASFDSIAPSSEDAAEEMPSLDLDNGSLGSAKAAEEGMAEDMGSDSEDYGKTNLQEEEIEEADIVKNDGRYIYHVVSTDFSLSKEGIQITDTKDGLQKAAIIDGFDEIEEIYVWKDTLVVVETGWASNAGKGTAESAFLEDIAYETTAPFSKLYIYDIKDRAKPEKYHEFTIKGDYKDSRISNGYLYFFAGYTAYRPQVERDYRAYVPEVDNEPLAADKIYLPEEMEGTSFLVMASIQMEQPDHFTDTKAIVAAAENFYVSKGNIYVANSQYIDYSRVGLRTDSTTIYRFSYQDGKMEKEAEGAVKGTLQDHFAMNEHEGYLRLVTTLNEEDLEKVTDDVSGEDIGVVSSGASTSNSLYVLDADLKVAGMIEDIARDERVYSVRFLGDTGYFVTFRQTDPLFSVDLSDPKKPEILGELKISGFSEYLHPYADGLLLGIGMEADENTGETDGLKLTMFDVSDPGDVKAETTLGLPEYDYAYALNEYKAVLIDTDKNLFGFCAEKYIVDESPYQYLLFSYENGEFQKRLEIDCPESVMDDSYNIRGTYIGEVFYLAYYSGRVEAYSLADGSKVGELAP